MADGKTQQAHDSENRLRRLYELALTVAGNPVQVFDRIVRLIAEVFGVRVALVERIEGDKIITLSMYLDGKILHEGVFDLEGTPCANVRENLSFCAFDAASERFPQDQFLKDYKIESYIGVPVVSTNGEVIAIINAMSDRQISLAADDRLFFEALASRVRLELEREQQATEAHFVRALLDISREVSSLHNLDKTLQLIVDRTRELLGFDMVALATVDDERGTTSWKATSGFRTEAYKSVSFAPGRGTAGRTIAARRTIIIEGIGQIDQFPAEEFPIHTAEGLRNSLGVPLLIGERAVGVLIAGYCTSDKLIEQDVRFAEAIAAQAAVAIENARLFTELASVNDRLMKADLLKSDLIAELSTPIIPLWDRVLLAPIIGTLDAGRAQAMTEALLEKTAGGGASVVILDITGVRVIDTDAARRLRNTATALRVLGAHCILTGIQASVAQTLVHLGISLEDITIRRKLSDALKLAIDLIAKQ